MKKYKIGKLIVSGLLFVMLLTGAFRLTASADEIPAANIEVDYVNETVTVETDEDEIIYFTEVYNKDVNRWDECEVRNGKAVFDISWIVSNKTVRLYICGDKNKDVVSVDITWEENF
ncbi:MAG: hypothetical protein J6K15_14575, partial [Lachnospiraceae bacterium]|nr:hypothetical protein [Lachnospiraceae bacterium]